MTATAPAPPVVERGPRGGCLQFGWAFNDVETLCSRCAQRAVGDRIGTPGGSGKHPLCS